MRLRSLFDRRVNLMEIVITLNVTLISATRGCNVWNEFGEQLVQVLLAGHHVRKRCVYLKMEGASQKNGCKLNSAPRSRLTDP